MNDAARHAHGSVLGVRNLGVRFRSRRARCITAVDGLSYELAAGKTLAIVGGSGAGKTVACRALMGLLPESAEISGSVKLAGTELVGLPEERLRMHRGADIAMVFQDPARALNPTMRVGRQVAEVVRTHARIDRRGARRRAIELLRRLEIDAPEQRYRAYAHELSGGTCQRVMIAIALAGRPRVLIADEATRSLDVATQAQVLELLRSLQVQLGMAIVMICHDLRVAAAFADDVLVMHAGRAVEHIRAAHGLDAARAPYTRALVAAMRHGGP